MSAQTQHLRKNSRQFFMVSQFVSIVLHAYTRFLFMQANGSLKRETNKQEMNKFTPNNHSCAFRYQFKTVRNL
jgi:hypothetical protein